MATIDGTDVGALPLDMFSPISFANVLVITTSLVCAYGIASSLYFLTLHPLAEVPGPRFCAISRIPYWLANIQGRDVQWLHQLHTEYGAVVRFGPTDLSYNTADAWKDIHGYGKGKSENAKAQEFSVQPVNGKS
jgi:hypothetical protein